MHRPTMDDEHNCLDIQPLIHSFSSQHVHAGLQAIHGSLISTLFVEKSVNSVESNFILIPSEDEDGNHRELLQKVYSYPQGTISIVFEKSSNRNILKEKDDKVLKSTDGLHKENFYIKKKGSIYSSANSIASTISSRQSADSKKIFKDSSLHFPVISNTNLELINAHKISNKFLDNEFLSDNSSLLSTVSDLNFYDEEYTAIKQVVSDIPITHLDRKSAFLHSMNKTSQTDSKFYEQDLQIKSLEICKEDLESKVHKLSSHLQKTIRENETSFEQFEIIQTKSSENSKKEYLQILKDKAALEGQYDALKHEHENCFFDKNLLQVKGFELQASLFEKNKEIEHYKKLNNEFENIIKELENKNSESTIEISLLKNGSLNYKDHLFKLERELEAHEKSLMKNEMKLSQNNLEIDTLKQSNEKLQELNLVYKREEGLYYNERKSLESKVSEADLLVTSLRDNQEYLQNELNKVHNHNTDLQKQLTEAKSSFTAISADRDRTKTELDRLNIVLEESVAKAIREKSSLLFQLNEVEAADMKEREVAVAKYDDDGLHIKVNKERFKKLEEDYKKFRINMGELQRENETLFDEMRHKKMLQNKNEEVICGLRKELIITQEKIRERELSVTAINSQLQEIKLKLENSSAIIMEKETIIAKLKEDKLQLDTLLNGANEDKRLVDIAISKLKEDMNKLTSNYYRMKHDIVAKERQIELLQEENSDLHHLKLELIDKLQNHNDEYIFKARNNALEEEINLLKVDLKREVNDKMVAFEKITSLKKTLASIANERKNADCALKLSNEQIISLQSSNKTYADKLQHKNQEISLSKDKLLQLEEDHNDLQKKFSCLNEEITNFQQNKEEFSETQNYLQKSIEDLQVNLKMEILARSSFEMKHKKLHEEFISQKINYKNQVDYLEKIIASFKNKLEEAKHTHEDYEKTITNVLNLKEQDILQPNQKIHEHLELDSFSDICEDIVNDENDLMESKNLDLLKQLTSKKAESEQFQVSDEPYVMPSCNSKSTNDCNTFNNNESQTHDHIRKLISEMGSKLQHNNACAISTEDFDSHNISSCNFHDFRQTLESKSNEVSALSSKISEINKEINNLKSENIKLTDTMEVKNERINLLEKELNDCKTATLLKENECQDWKLKYEGLCEYIPQKDTNNTRQAVALHHAQFQVFNSKHAASSDSASYEEPAHLKFYAGARDGCKITKSQSLNLIFDGEASDSSTLSTGWQPFEINDTFTIPQTIPDQHLFKFNHNLHSFPVNFDQKSTDCSTLLSFNDKEYSSTNIISSTNLTFENILNEKKASLKSIKLPELMHSENAVILDEMKIKLCENEAKILELRNTLSEKNRHATEIESKLYQKESEYQNKHRLYQSNIRLLTRKLKEHMKGRRACEKDLESMMQENMKKIEGEEKRYNLLHERNMEIDAICEHLKSEKITCEISKNNIRQELEEVKKSFETQKCINLDLQKNLGHMEELKDCLNSLKSQEKFLEAEIQHLKILNVKIQEKFEKEEAEKLSLSKQCNEFCLNIDLLKKNIMTFNDENLAKEKKIDLLEMEIANKLQEISTLSDELKELKEQLVNANNSIKLREAQEDLLKIENGSLKVEIDTLNSSLLQKKISLEECLAKNTLLMEELKLKEYIIVANKQQIESIQYQMDQAKENHSAAIALMNTKIINATEVESSLNEKLKSILEQKYFYQTQTAEFQASLNTALSHLRNLQRSRSPTPMPILPSPSPLDTHSLLKLMEKCSGPPPGVQCFTSLTKRLSALRGEVASLQLEIKTDLRN